MDSHIFDFFNEFLVQTGMSIGGRYTYSALFWILDGSIWRPFGGNENVRKKSYIAAQRGTISHSATAVQKGTLLLWNEIVFHKNNRDC